MHTERVLCGWTYRTLDFFRRRLKYPFGYKRTYKQRGHAKDILFPQNVLDQWLISYLLLRVIVTTLKSQTECPPWTFDGKRTPTAGIEVVRTWGYLVILWKNLHAFSYSGRRYKRTHLFYFVLFFFFLFFSTYQNVLLFTLVF